MSAMWGGFQTNVAQFLSNQSAANEDATADFFATEYDSAVKTATTVMQNQITGGTNKDVLKSAFQSCFSMQKASSVDLGLAPYSVMAAGFVAYWATAQFNPMPPHPPCVAPSTGIQLVLPGTPSPLDTMLMSAFKAGMALPNPSAAANLIAGLLVSAFTAHLMTITGLYIGLMPNPVVPPVPPLIPAPPVPWVGII